MRSALLGAAVLLCQTLLLGQSNPPRADQSKYLGPGSCAASACHGGMAPQKSTSVLQNEFSVWVMQDKHSNAFRVLQNPVAQRMGRILKIGDPTASPKCLLCHALYISPEQKGRDFDISEGVTCENCHGPSSAWLGVHTMKGYSRPQLYAMGQYNTKDLVSRTEKCMTCHMGTKEKFVDHEMIAAGHPDLVFELDSFSAVMPAHWKPESDPFHGVKAWSVGEAVKLEAALQRLQRRADGPVWPEYSELECFSCHHTLVKAESSWRQSAGYRDRKAGVPPWNPAHFVIFRQLVKEIDPATATKLDGQLLEVYTLTSRLDTDRAAIAKAAGAAAQTAGELGDRLNGMNLDHAVSMRLSRAIVADANSISNEGPRAAEQAAMALESIAAASEAAGNKQADTRNEIRSLFKLLDNPSGYSAPQFAAQMKKVGATLR
jgi:cytochrome c554/c'-like protein